ncbi:transferase family III protein [Venturia nashicola]|uniref:Transferase family III protein n=1 Tax=Venturia nashicola TaxID=86259 RepID=A0A4Z1NT19_9PEZI|nr:transferase family III protein [Venturia nashicola]TLD18972.1 transferase family III protein [Venturia nashicola]
MPGLPSALSLNNPADPNAFTPLFARAVNAANVTNATSQALQVVCAFPVSGQYGPGSRVLYYVLVAACVIGRKSKLLMNACLAAALLFPAVAAIHGIVLAALHVDGAVDMDIFGAFQLCSIAILAAPVMARMSKTYFYNSNRNIIFLWTGLLLAGLLSLTVEFYRVTSSSCTKDDNGSPISNEAQDFPYESNPTCGLTCSTTDGPFSHLRGGSVNNIYVIPVPSRLSFGEATVMAAACCIPAILSLISMRNKILYFNWRKNSGKRPEKNEKERIKGTKATIGSMKNVNSTLRLVLGRVEIVLFGGLVLAILVIGERNFFSKQVLYESEPMYAIGQWAPIVGTSLAVIASLGLLLVKEKPGDEEENTTSLGRHPNCPHCDHGHAQERRPTFELTTDDVDDPQASGEPQDIDDYIRKHTNEQREFDTSSAIDWKDDAAFKAADGPATDYPETPGEMFKRDLSKVKEHWSHRHARRSTEGEMSPAMQHASTFSGSPSGTSANAMERWTSMPRPSSPEMLQRKSTLEVPPVAHLGHKRTRSDSSGAGKRPGSGIESIPGRSSPSLGPLKRNNTLEVPFESHVLRTRSNSAGSYALPSFREPSELKDSGSGSNSDKG